MQLPLTKPQELLTAAAICRSKRRRTIGIKLDNNGQWQLLIPAAASEEQILKAAAHFLPWLNRKLIAMSALPPEQQPFHFEFAIDAEFYYLGKSYPLKYIENSRSQLIVFREDAFWSPSLDPHDIKVMFEAFYRRQARRLITGKLEQYSQKFNTPIGEISINGARRRFGSCNSRGDLNFSWHLAMYPAELIELVILHELSHRHEMNHSPKFYKVLANFLPDHRERNKQLQLWSRKLSGYPR